MYCSRIFIAAIIFLQCLCSNASAFLSFRGPHYVGLGPEVYFMQRKKEGGSTQRGFLFGARAKYERIRRSALYWGTDLQWAAGTLCGHNASHSEVRSFKRDAEIEGRFGYTWKRKLGCNFWITPFIGSGYFEGANRFIHPSPKEYMVCNTAPYLLGGFLARFDIKRYFSVGVNFKAKYTVGVRSCVTDDLASNVKKEHLIGEDKFSYNLDVPLYFDFSCGGRQLEISFVPFYNFRHYGTHENFPHDFIDTRFHMYGARLIFSCLF